MVKHFFLLKQLYEIGPCMYCKYDICVVRIPRICLECSTAYTQCTNLHFVLEPKPRIAQSKSSTAHSTGLQYKFKSKFFGQGGIPGDVYVQDDTMSSCSRSFLISINPTVATWYQMDLTADLLFFPAGFYGSRYLMLHYSSSQSWIYEQLPELRSKIKSGFMYNAHLNLIT